MMHPLRAVLTVLGFAAVTATSGLALLTPHVTHADGEDRTGTFNSGTVYATASFEKDDTVKNGWKIVIDAQNPGDTAATDDFDVSVLYAVSNPGSRVGSPGTAVWRHKENLVLAAHEKLQKVVACPASIARQLTAIEKAQEKREAMIATWQNKGTDIPQWVWQSYNAPRAAYWVEAMAKPDAAPAKAPTQMKAVKAKT